MSAGEIDNYADVKAAEVAKDAEKSSLYERDPYSWAREQSRALRDRRSGELDWDNLTEEVEDLAGRHEDALQGNYEVLLERLAKLAHPPALRRSSNLRLWQLHARNARLRIESLLKKRPRLRALNSDLFIEAWPYARNTALGLLGLGDDRLPEQCPWTLEQACDESFWPDPSSARQAGRRGRAGLGRSRGRRIR